MPAATLCPVGRGVIAARGARTNVPPTARGPPTDVSRSIWSHCQEGDCRPAGRSGDADASVSPARRLWAEARSTLGAFRIAAPFAPFVAAVVEAAGGARAASQFRSARRTATKCR
jgi:hypothetical protein